MRHGCWRGARRSRALAQPFAKSQLRGRVPQPPFPSSVASYWSYFLTGRIPCTQLIFRGARKVGPCFFHHHLAAPSNTFHSSFESHPACKPLPSPNVSPTASHIHNHLITKWLLYLGKCSAAISYEVCSPAPPSP